jgi:hypothetical protein
MNISLDACPNSAGINVFGANWRRKKGSKAHVSRNRR